MLYHWELVKAGKGLARLVTRQDMAILVTGHIISWGTVIS
jgi:hypothetical protein